MVQDVIKFVNDIKKLDGINLTGNRLTNSWLYEKRIPNVQTLSLFVVEMKIKYPEHKKELNDLVIKLMKIGE